MTVTMTTADCTLDVGGMTCASCVGRVERALHKIDGVNDAQVNLATEVATVSFDPTRVDTDDLVRAVTRAGYTATPKRRTSEDAAEVAPAEPDDDRELRRFKRQWQITLAAGLGLMVLMYVPFYIDTMDILMPAVLAVSTVVLAWAGRDVYRSAWTAARHGSVGMNTLVALSTAVAYGYSAFVTLWPSLAEQWGLPLHVYFETALVILALVMAGRWMEARAKKSTAAAITALMDLAPPTARVLRDGTERELPIDQVVVGDLIRIRPGDTVPVDAEVTEGSSTVDESLITGESQPVDKVLGDSLLAGTANRTGSVLARVSAVGADTALAQITRLVQEAQAGKVPMQRLADRISAWFIPIVLALAALTFTGWLLFGPDTGRLTMAVSTSIAVLIIACPCALGLATPTAVMVGTGRAAELGILIGNGDALQRAAGLTAVVLDKTGTITTGRPTLTGVHPATGWTRDEVLALAAAAEMGSEHPVGEAIVAAAHGLTRPAVQSFEALPGYGITAAVDGRSVLAGNAALMAAHGVDIDRLTAVEDGTPVFLAVDGIGVAVLTVADTVKSESAGAIAALQALGLQVWMLTGDTATTAAVVAEQVGIPTDRVLADVRPAEKAAAIGCLQDDGQIVAMVGDGINDAAALSTADVGIAIGTGADVAIAASDITLVGGDLRGIVSAIALSRRTVATMKQGLGWAFAYNVLLIPVAAGALYLVGGPLLDPILASAAMAMSSVSVLTNALRLRRFERTASAEQILHPPLRQRVGQWSYLATVATVALLIGGTLNAVSRMDFAARGMNGTLAWTQGTGMPMRPAMSVMMTADVPPDEAADAGVDVRLDLPADARAGEPTRVVVTVVDVETEAPIADLVRSHEAWMHLIATRADLGTFAHVRPQPTGRAGELAVDLVFPTAGDYIVNTEFRRQGRLADVHQRIVLTVAGDAPAPDRAVIGPRSVIVDGVRVELAGEARAEGRSDLHFTFTDEATGRPLDDLQPYLAAAGHVVIMRADGATFTHEHAETRDEQGRPEFAVPGTTFGPDLGVHTELDGPGRYRIWGQFRLSDGRLITAPFTVDAS
ncbi:MAG TPA: heavy metal translocating P-type ATPase [Nakamurella sp.]